MVPSKAKSRRFRSVSSAVGRYDIDLHDRSQEKISYLQKASSALDPSCPRNAVFRPLKIRKRQHRAVSTPFSKLVRSRSLSVPNLEKSFLSVHSLEAAELSSHNSSAVVAYGLPSPPTSDPDELELCRCKSTTPESSDGYPFPLEPKPLTPQSQRSSGPDGKCSPVTPIRRVVQKTDYWTPPSTPDRYIANRSSPQEPSQTFRFSKVPSQLTSSEKLLRNNSASQDPFGPLRLPRLRNMDNSNQSPSGRRNGNLRGRLRTRLLGATNMLSLPQDVAALQTRHASHGAIWNVGGNSQMTHASPIRSISNGRGGLMSSGSYAPMFVSKFLNNEMVGQEGELMETRLAAALELDPTRKVFDFSRNPGQTRSASTGSIEVKEGISSNMPRTRWKHGEWVFEGFQSPKKKRRSSGPEAVPTTPFRVLDAPNLRDDYYCTVLAYCRVARTLAVGLGNRVYLWTEAFGVRYPPEPPSPEQTYVTSLSFSSVEGGHSILAAGRNSGQITLWSMHDRENIRFQSQQPQAISCVSFKPVCTRRQSERFGCLMAVEELLVGDEVGNVYYYSVEWMNRQQIDIHGWAGAMNLLAKITVHNQQICGLAWSLDGEFFATGANDNLCCLFQVNQVIEEQQSQDELETSYRNPFQTIFNGLGLPNVVRRTSTPSDLISILANGIHSRRSRVTPSVGQCRLIGDDQIKHKWMHSAAIKAIAFCPWQRGLIATGGGSNDRAIHFYHTFSGASLATINVHAQVTSLIWSTTRREIAATFGYAQPEHPYRIAVFSWPDCRQILAIPWQSDTRALYAIAFPGGPGETTAMGGTWWSRTRDEGSIVVASSDESVKFHEVWSGPSRSTVPKSGFLGGSDILEGLEGIEREDRVIR